MTPDRDCPNEAQRNEESRDNGLGECHCRVIIRYGPGQRSSESGRSRWALTASRTSSRIGAGNRITTSASFVFVHTYVHIHCVPGHLDYGSLLSAYTDTAPTTSETPEIIIPRYIENEKPSLPLFFFSLHLVSCLSRLPGFFVQKTRTSEYLRLYRRRCKLNFRWMSCLLKWGRAL